MLPVVFLMFDFKMSSADKKSQCLSFHTCNKQELLGVKRLGLRVMVGLSYLGNFSVIFRNTNAIA